MYNSYSKVLRLRKCNIISGNFREKFDQIRENVIFLGTIDEIREKFYEYLKK